MELERAGRRALRVGKGKVHAVGPSVPLVPGPHSVLTDRELGHPLLLLVPKALMATPGGISWPELLRQ